MLKYQDYLKKCAEEYDLYTEKDFQEIAELFPKLDTINWDEVDNSSLNVFSGESLTISILDFILENTGAAVDANENFKEVTLDYIDNEKDLEEAENRLKEHGWTISNKDEILDDLKELEEAEKAYNLKSTINIIISSLTTEQLNKVKEFIGNI